ncbi:MAG TPA: L-serine ammonia-lyase, iron-sulfur-dependent, subunit alpha, partial [Cerasibacillus sp.]
MFRTVAELIDQAKEDDIPISEVMIRQEMDVKNQTREQVFAQMENNLRVMEKAIEDSLQGVQSVTGL